MGTLSLLPLFPLNRRQTPSFPPQPHSFSSSLLLRIPSAIKKLPYRREPLTLRSGIRATPDDSQFRDEDGVVDDMDGYLNYLSLEYDSVWDTKPSWCQPWTILLTGIGAVVCSWLFLHSIVISAGVFSVICIWWYIFLYLYPKAYSNMIAERRKNVSSGIEDTFGLRKSQ